MATAFCSHICCCRGREEASRAQTSFQPQKLLLGPRNGLEAVASMLGNVASLISATSLPPHCIYSHPRTVGSLWTKEMPPPETAHFRGTGNSFKSPGDERTLHSGVHVKRGALAPRSPFPAGHRAGALVGWGEQRSGPIPGRSRYWSQRAGSRPAQDGCK